MILKLFKACVKYFLINLTLLQSNTVKPEKYIRQKYIKRGTVAFSYTPGLK